MQRQTDLLNNESHSSHVWWKKAKQLSKISGGNENIPDLEGNSVKASSDMAKAKLLAQFFWRPVSNTYCNPGNFRKRLIFVLFVSSWNL